MPAPTPIAPFRALQGRGPGVPLSAIRPWRRQSRESEAPTSRIAILRRASRPRRAGCPHDLDLTSLTCSASCGAGPFDPDRAQHLCPACGMPLLARYDLAAAARSWDRASLAGRPRTMWRFQEVLRPAAGPDPCRWARAARRSSMPGGSAPRWASTGST